MSQLTKLLGSHRPDMNSVAEFGETPGALEVSNTSTAHQ